MSTPHELETKLQHAEKIIKGFERVIVAYSGGVDSTLLVKLARDVLGRDGVLAVTANSPSLAQRDLQETYRLAKWLDVEHRVIDTAEVEHPAYRANSGARCYFCKQELFAQLTRMARERQRSIILYGAIGDDQLEERPGAVAAREYKVRAPLQEAGLSKAEIREVARRAGLPNWDRPQNACLSSRIPHGLEVTEQKLQRVEQAEAVLIGLGFRQVRVRYLDAHARIEVGKEEVARFEDPEVAETVARQVRALGFRSIGVVRAGYRPGGADQTAIEEFPLLVKSGKQKVES